MLSFGPEVGEVAQFQPGISGNPAGRPRGARIDLAHLRQLAGEHGEHYIDRLHAIVKGQNRRLALEAIKFALPYLIGKPVEVQVTIDPAALHDLSDADLEAALRVAERLGGG